MTATELLLACTHDPLEISYRWESTEKSVYVSFDKHAWLWDCSYAPNDYQFFLATGESPVQAIQNALNLYQTQLTLDSLKSKPSYRRKIYADL
jgi:hypothetical protein